jgi:hypothetical protein
MRLVCDDIDGVYYWSEELDENLALSPHFDYIEDALEWRERMAKLLSSGGEKQ